jgi:single-strand DNA-binding protein
MSFHTVIVVGNLGKDPEMRYLPSGQAVTSFSVASSRKFTSSDGTVKDETIWFRVSAWGKQAETCNTYLKKGNKVIVEGRLVAGDNGSPRIWNRQDGTPGASFEISASTVRFLTPKGEGGGAEETEAPADEGDIPF